MELAKLTSKGQITIPKDVREKEKRGLKQNEIKNFSQTSVSRL